MSFDGVRFVITNLPFGLFQIHTHEISSFAHYKRVLFRPLKEVKYNR